MIPISTHPEWKWARGGFVPTIQLNRQENSKYGFVIKIDKFAIVLPTYYIILGTYQWLLLLILYE